MSENPYEAPNIPAEPKRSGEPQSKDAHGWSLKRSLVVALVSPLAVLIWIGACLGIAWLMMTLDWPGPQFRVRVGPESMMALIGVLAAFPAVGFELTLLRLSRRLVRTDHAP
jgi:hypothetical protein